VGKKNRFHTYNTDYRIDIRDDFGAINEEFHQIGVDVVVGLSDLYFVEQAGIDYYVQIFGGGLAEDHHVALLEFIFGVGEEEEVVEQFVFVTAAEKRANDILVFVHQFAYPFDEAGTHIRYGLYKRPTQHDVEMFNRVHDLKKQGYSMTTIKPVSRHMDIILSGVRAGKG